MGQKSQILVDTDIIIKVYRGHKDYKHAFEKEKSNLAVSAITYLELLYGLKTRRRIIDLHKQMKAFNIIQLSESISLKGLEIANKHGVSNSIKPADALIAATALVMNLLIFTDNQQDFNFIKDIRFYKS
jgi:hypothetical protein